MHLSDGEASFGLELGFERRTYLLHDCYSVMFLYVSKLFIIFPMYERQEVAVTVRSSLL